jgi:transient receptor potential cation channel subfamily A protein 1
MESEFQTYFVSVPRSFLKMVEYLLGNVEFNFYLSDIDMPHPGLTWTLVLIAVIFLPIIFMNILIGLAVGDIEVVRKNAHLKRLAMQVELHMETERKIPMSIKRRLCKKVLKNYPNRCYWHWRNVVRHFGQLYNCVLTWIVSLL